MVVVIISTVATLTEYKREIPLVQVLPLEQVGYGELSDAQPPWRDGTAQIAYSVITLEASVIYGPKQSP
jgi:hypothetical protein